MEGGQHLAEARIHQRKERPRGTLFQGMGESSKLDPLERRVE